MSDHNNKAREAARGMLHEFERMIQVPDYGDVQWASDGTAYVEALIEVPAAMLREEKG